MVKTVGHESTSLTQPASSGRQASASVLIDQRGKILYQHGPVDDYLQVSGGDPDHDIGRLARPGLRNKLRTAVRQAIEDGKRVIVHDARVKRGHRYFPVRILIDLLRKPSATEGLLLVAFYDTTYEPSGDGDDPPVSPVGNNEQETTRSQEVELAAVPEDLRTTIEKLVTGHDEIQVTADAMRKSRQKRQATKNDLQAVNRQLATTLDELGETPDELSNVLTSLDQAVVILDRQLCIRRFTQAATRLFPLTDGDISRTLGLFVSTTSDEELLCDAESVLRRLSPIEKEVRDSEGCCYLRRIVPYRTRDDRVDGVVLTYLDITQQKHDARVLQEELKLITDAMSVAVTRCSRDLRFLWVNRHGAQWLGRSPEEIIGRPIVEILGEEAFAQLLPRFQQVLAGQKVSYEQEINDRSLGSRWVYAEYSPTFDTAGAVDGWVAAIADITGQKLADQAVRDSEARKRAILESSLDAIISIDHEGLILEWNPAAEEMFGRKREHVLGKELGSLIVPQVQRDQYRAGLAKVLETGVGPILGKRLEMSALRGDGTEFPAEVAIVRVQSDGPPTFKGFVRDITERKQGEVALRESESRFRAMTDSAPMLVWMTGQDKRRTYFNASWLGFTGRSIERELGDGWVEGVHPDDCDRCLRTYVSAFDAREPFELEYRLRRHDGDYRWVLDRGVPRLGREGSFLGYIGSCLEIHDRKQAQLALQDSEERLRLATEGAGIGIWEWEFATDQATWNEIESVLIGCGPVQPHTDVREFFNRVHADDLPELRRAIERAIEENANYDHEFRVVLADGQIRWLAGKGEVYRDAGGRAVKMMGVNFDITDRKRLEQTLRTLNESLERQVVERIESMHNLQHITRAANEARTVEQAMKKALEAICRFKKWPLGHVCRRALAGEEMVCSGIWHVEDDLRQTEFASFQNIAAALRFCPGGVRIGQVIPNDRPGAAESAERGRWREGMERVGLRTAIWFPVLVDGEVAAILEFFSKQVIKEDEAFTEIMSIVDIQLSHVIQRERSAEHERQLEQEMAELTDSERQRLGRELHDTLGQECTAISMLVTTLKYQTNAASNHKEVIDRLAQCAEAAKKQLRLLTKGMFPVDLDASGLRVALEDLAEETARSHGIDCRLECSAPILLEENFIATQLFLIVREAVHNAVKHSQAKRITINVERASGKRISIRDDGLGLPASADGVAGMGMRIMRHRCGLIGRQIHFQCSPGGGTLVTISSPEKP